MHAIKVGVQNLVLSVRGGDGVKVMYHCSQARTNLLTSTRFVSVIIIPPTYYISK
jgi:hypothetical protein